jgi:diguanylate cyclase (GGDEF)-like protein
VFLGSVTMTAGLIFSALITLKFPDPSTRVTFLILIGAMLALNIFGIVYLLLQIYRPIQILIQETEETLQGLRSGDISVIRDDELGLLANSFNQIILDAQMKRMELETSNVELASHAEIIEKTYRELDKKVYDLFTLFNIGKELNSTLSMESILKIACFTSMGQLGITVMTIMLMENREGHTMSTVYEKGLRGKQEHSSTLVCSEEFMNLLRLSEQPLLHVDLEGKPEFAPELVFFTEHKSAMIIPLTVKKNVVGLLMMGKKLSGEEFTQGEKDFVNTLGSLAAIALENARLYELAITDAMTKLFLKRYFQLRLDDEFKRAERYKGKLAMAMIDIDHFKRINDTYGHTKGDEVLISVAKSIKENFRDVDIAARYGGEEFSVIMPEVSKEDALIAAERLRKTVEAVPHELNGKNVVITISIGLAEAPKDASTPLALVEAADAALYRSKETGRNRCTLA